MSLNLRKIITGRDKLPPRVMKNLEEKGIYVGMGFAAVYKYVCKGGKIIRYNILTQRSKFYDSDGWAWGEKRE